MFKTFMALLIAFSALLSASNSSAAQYQFAFQVWNGPVPPMAFDPSSDLGKANSAFLAKYSTEQGFLGTTVGNNNELIILVAGAWVSRDLWTKMLNAKDAYTAGNGISYFTYGGVAPQPNPVPPPQQPQPQPIPNPQPQPQPIPNPPQQPAFQYLGRISIPEVRTGRFFITNGTPAIRGYVLTIDQTCPIVRSGVEVIGNMPVQPTQLVRSFRSGARLISYEFAVNGGRGAPISAVDISVGAVGGPIIIDICSVDVSARF